MRKIRTDRLRIVADHLLNGQLGHEKFDFGELNSIINLGTRSNPIGCCGTNGCAIGELPIIFPENWIFSTSQGYPFLKKGSSNSTWIDVNKFFNIERDEEYHLFLPNNQNIDQYGGLYLDVFASKEDVAQKIITFCDLMEERGFHYVG